MVQRRHINCYTAGQSTWLLKFKRIHYIFHGHVAVLMCENCDKLGMCNPQKYNHENPACLLYSENFISQKF